MLSILLLLFGQIFGIHSGEMERHIFETILSNYNSLERPVDIESKALQLNLGLSLKQLINLDEKNQLMTAYIKLHLDWRDYSLVWNKTSFGNIENVPIPATNIWTPDLLLYNSASSTFDNTYKVNVHVNHDGYCSYQPPCILESTCEIDITWFPFDEQVCILKFGSWTYEMSFLNLTVRNSSANIMDFSTNGEWELISVPAERHEIPYECCPDSKYVDITYYIKLRRRTMYYFANLIFPCVLIAFMAVIGFYFPPDSGEKITLELTIMMSLTFFMNMVTDIQPPSSETPLIGIYFSCIMIMVASSVICTILILNFHHHLASSDSMPKWFHSLFLQWIPWALQMSRPGYEFNREAFLLKNESEENENKDEWRLVKDLEIKKWYSHNNSNCVVPFDSSFSSDSDPNQSIEESLENTPDEITLSIRAILTEIQIITNKIRDEDKASSIESDWKFAAMVLDRICLIAFLFFITLLSIAVLIAAPHIIVW